MSENFGNDDLMKKYIQIGWKNEEVTKDKCEFIPAYIISSTLFAGVIFNSIINIEFNNQILLTIGTICLIIAACCSFFAVVTLTAIHGKIRRLYATSKYRFGRFNEDLELLQKDQYEQNIKNLNQLKEYNEDNLKEDIKLYARVWFYNSCDKQMINNNTEPFYAPCKILNYSYLSYYLMCFSYFLYLMLRLIDIYQNYYLYILTYILFIFTFVVTFILLHLSRAIYDLE